LSSSSFTSFSDPAVGTRSAWMAPKRGSCMCQEWATPKWGILHTGKSGGQRGGRAAPPVGKRRRSRAPSKGTASVRAW
jgi:hypothetical protein